MSVFERNHAEFWLLISFSSFYLLNCNIRARLCRVNTFSLNLTILLALFHVWYCPPLPPGRLATLCLLSWRAGSPAALSKASPCPHAGTLSARRKCGWTNTSSTTTKPGRQPLASHLEGKLLHNLRRRALVSRLLARNSYGIFSGT